MNLRNTNPWLASCGSNVRANETTRPSRHPARSVRLWAGALLAVLLTFAITAGEHVAAEGADGSPGRYPLDQNDGVVASSPSLDRYLAALEERATQRRFLLTFGDLLFGAGSAQIGDSEKRQLVRMGDFLRAHPATVAQIQSGRAGNRRVEILVQRSPMDSSASSGLLQ